MFRPTLTGPNAVEVYAQVETRDRIRRWARTRGIGLALMAWGVTRTLDRLFYIGRARSSWRYAPDGTLVLTGWGKTSIFLIFVGAIVGLVGHIGRRRAISQAAANPVTAAEAKLQEAATSEWIPKGLDKYSDNIDLPPLASRSVLSTEPMIEATQFTSWSEVQQIIRDAEYPRQGEPRPTEEGLRAVARRVRRKTVRLEGPMPTSTQRFLDKYDPS
jgi:hypothetical protein